VADMMRVFFGADCAILEPELLGVDKVISAGKIRLGMLEGVDGCESHVRILTGSAILELLS